MYLMIHPEKLSFSRKVLPLTLAMGLSLSACSQDGNEKANDQDALTSVRVLGAAKDGNINAVNGGDSATIYDGQTYKSIGKIAGEEAFLIVCIDTKPNSLTVLEADQEGTVNLTNAAVSSLTDSEIPVC